MVVACEVVAVSDVVFLVHELFLQFVEACVDFGNVDAGGVTVDVGLKFLDGLFCQLLVKIVLGRLQVFAFGGKEEGLLGAFAVGESFVEVLELVSCGVVILYLHEGHAIVPRNVLGVFAAVVVHNQVFVQLYGS